METQFTGLKPSDFVTLASVAVGVASMALSLQGAYMVAAAAIAVAVGLDFFDGIAARGSKTGATLLGKQLDSLSDIVSFGVAPIVLVFSQQSNPLVIAGGMVYAAAGVVRLAKFNLQEEKGVFIGVPIPVAALMVILSWALGGLVGSVSMLFFAAFLMVSPLRFPKPSLS